MGSVSRQLALQVAVSVSVTARRQGPVLRFEPLTGECVEVSWRGGVIIFSFSMQPCGSMVCHIPEVWRSFKLVMKKDRHESDGRSEPGSSTSSTRC